MTEIFLFGMAVIWALVLWPLMWLVRRLGIMSPRDPDAHYQ